MKLEQQIPYCRLEESPPKIPGCCLVRAHEQPNTDPNPYTHPKANSNTNSNTSIEPRELSVLAGVHLLRVETIPHLPIKIIIINFRRCYLQDIIKVKHLVFQKS